MKNTDKTAPISLTQLLEQTKLPPERIEKAKSFFGRIESEDIVQNIRIKEENEKQQELAKFEPIDQKIDGLMSGFDSDSGLKTA
jgi:DNA polymerase/3'-5' exonuclease PolX